MKDEWYAAVIGLFTDMTKVEKLLKKTTLKVETRNECEDVSTAVKVSHFTLMCIYKSEYQDCMLRLVINRDILL